MSTNPTMPKPPTTLTQTLAQSAASNVRDIDQEQLSPEEIQQYIKTMQWSNIRNWCNEQWTKVKGARGQQETQWYNNIIAYGKNERLQVQKQPNGHPRAIQKPGGDNKIWINRIRPYVRTEVARFTSNEPTATIVPATDDETDIFHAQQASEVWSNQYKYRGVRKAFIKAAFNMSVFGNGFIKTWWDDNAIDDRVEGANERGDIMYGNVSPFNLWVPDFFEEDIEEQLFVVNAYTKGVDWVKNFYAEELKANGIVNLQASVVGNREIIDEARMGIRSQGKTSPDSVLIKEFWIKPGATEHLPNGGVVTMIDNYLIKLKDDGMLYPHGMYPFAKFDNIPTGGFYSASGIEDLEPINREYNILRGIIRRVGSMNANPQFFYNTGSLDPKKITNAPGQYIPVMPGMQFPQPVPKTDIPNSIYQSLESTKMDFEDVSGQHQVSKGAAPPGVTAATAINYLQEKDDSYSATAYDSIELGMEVVAKQTLNLAGNYWTAERKINVIGEDEGLLDSFMASKSNLSNATNVRIDGGSSLPQSAAAKRAYYLELLQIGAIDQAQFLEMSEIGGNKSILKTINIDKNHAMRENIRFRNLTPEYAMAFNEQYKAQIAEMAENDPEGFLALQLEEAGLDSLEEFMSMKEDERQEVIDSVPPPEPPLVIPVNDWDNHEVHIEFHNRFRKSQGYEMLPPEIQEIVDEHVQQHEDKLKDKQMNEMMDMDLGFGGEMDGMGQADMGEGQLPPDLFDLNKQFAGEEEQPVDTQSQQ